MVVHSPSNGYELERALEERFGFAQYTNGTARQAVKRLMEDGLVRRRSPSVAVAGAGRRQPAVFEATDAGLEHFLEWKLSPCTSPPVREELLAKLASCGPADLGRLMESVEQEIKVCLSKVQAASEAFRTRDEKRPEDHWQRFLQAGLRAGTDAWWSGRLGWLQELQAYLQEHWCDLEGPNEGGR
jgi:DNA-binding PadR family transcriptional regulator